ncbi:KaiC/GvpD/RAD55 family RecA-like ATPase [Bacillus mesophilus]|uniref:Uncharacterized protein n=1 Tax=Bacillus mesophilus TaxID=1808955 RepID=A0A6M0Q9Y0_9BACI|nr:hypothetical protein [Bacillus mesophilus]MBM7661654.1 KaiC/GvpD/RAD55 family RecA-like ATPase [Bacillus mesophilus]NEY72320.1 hypothetical protein [Bacillus mesophilus]
MLIGTIIGIFLTGIMGTVVYFQYLELEEIYQERKNTRYHHVTLEDGKEGIRIDPSGRMIMRHDTTEQNWRELIKLVEE